MKAYTKKYLEYFDYAEDDAILCEICGNVRATDCHHIEPRSKRMDLLTEVSNIIGLCRTCHTKAHNEEYSKALLKEVHEKFMKHNGKGK
jgi:5-methylcytosine-specific restriction endonuclease McrA